MISVRCLGHIGTSVGSKEVQIESDLLSAGELIERLAWLSKQSDPGFTKFNTLVMVEEGEAFLAATPDKQVRDGDRVVVIPFSHGG